MPSKLRTARSREVCNRVRRQSWSEAPRGHELNRVHRSAVLKAGHDQRTFGPTGRGFTCLWCRRRRRRPCRRLTPGEGSRREPKANDGAGCQSRGGGALRGSCNTPGETQSLWAATVRSSARGSFSHDLRRGNNGNARRSFGFAGGSLDDAETAQLDGFRSTSERPRTFAH